MRRWQRGGFVMGLIVGLLLGLALALAVALYVTKSPVPFVNKVQQRSPEQDAAEAQRNKDWNPNAPLANKPAHAAASAATAAPPAASAVVEPPKSTRDAAAILSGRDPAAIALAPRSAKPGLDPFIYFVQVGAFGKPEDAEAQRAKLAMLGYSAKVSERDQQGRTVYRVRLGPYEAKDEAESTQTKLQSGGEVAALVRVER
ncbi:MAG: SPOR domain-containing protein [Burkholderiaceae bacterium]|nr:SPOR domain-containing protein [Ideonella sp.]MCC7286800.1 SPOR domain-containing protein [Burkholderiaceae bacterium]